MSLGKCAACGGVCLDADAIAPATAREAARLVEAGGGSYFNGRGCRRSAKDPLACPAPASTCRDPMARGSPSSSTEPQWTPACSPITPTTASALKMCFAAWTKGTTALLL